MTLDSINESRTLILLSPYIALYFVFYFYVRDTFFFKPRSDVQTLCMMWVVGIVIFELFAWSLVFPESHFFNFESFKSDSAAIGVLLGAAAAIIGWLFTTREQAISATKANSLQILMQSRFSDEYSRNLQGTTQIYTTTTAITSTTSTPRTQLDVATYTVLNADEKRYISYMLNYYEFIAVGIRCGDLNEELMKKSLRTIILTNYNFYKLIIEDKQKKTPSSLENLVALAKRWN